MPRPPQPCMEPGCPSPAARRSRCLEHDKAKRRRLDQQRPSSRERGHTPKWAAFRRQYLTEHPWCECHDPDCHGPGECLADAHDIDHIDGTGRTGPRAYDPTNLQALCRPCHSRKTVRQDGGFGH